LSLLSFHDPSARVEGLEEVPVYERPPVNVVRIAFQTMVGIGFVAVRVRGSPLLADVLTDDL
jgi:cytochrome bd-type quinol oxidase subunit 1